MKRDEDDHWDEISRRDSEALFAGLCLVALVGIVLVMVLSGK